MRPSGHGEVSGVRDGDGRRGHGEGAGTGVWDGRVAWPAMGRGVVGHGTTANKRAMRDGARIMRSHAGSRPSG
jgi:hypothetical protein